MPLQASFILSNGASLPAVGLGTFQGESGTNSGVKDAVLAALLAGYRHLDTSSAYGNEQQIGEALRQSGIPRNEVFVTAKLYNNWHQPEDVEEAMGQSLKALGLDYVDLYLMHFPYAYLSSGPDHSIVRHPSGNGKPVLDYKLSRAYPEVWKAMEALVDQGKTRAIGFCNFNMLKTKRILKTCRIRPVVNQVELHPYLPQKNLLEFCKHGGIHLMAHQSLGGRPIAAIAPNSHIPGPLKDEKIIEIANRNGKTPAQVLLSWAVQRGTSVIPKSTDPEHLVQNLQVFELNGKDFEAIDNLKTDDTSIRYLDPRNYLGFDVFSEEADEPLIDRAPWDL